MVPQLDYQLQSRGIGAGDRKNLFSLIGFGRDSPEELTGVVLSRLASLPEFLEALDLLESSGGAEDGYAALDFAIRVIETRPDTVKQVILVTDEDRQVIRTDLDRSTIENTLQDSGFVLNVVVNQGFLADPADNNSYAMGLDSNRTAYVYDDSSPTFFSTSPDGVPNFNPFTFFPNTYTDYVELALSLGGAAWDINFVLVGEPLSLALAAAFAEVKVEEVMAVMHVCESCVCVRTGPVCLEGPTVSLDACTGPSPGNFVRTVCIYIHIF